MKSLEEKEKRLRRAAEESEKKREATKEDTVQTQEFKEAAKIPFDQQAANKNSGSGQSKRTTGKEAERELRDKEKRTVYQQEQIV